MTQLTSAVLAHLAHAGFHAREGGLSPFGDPLPLVEGVAWDRGTAQLALIAEARNDVDLEGWRQLLFAASGLRHHLRSDDTPAGYGTPVVLAVVDEAGERALRRLVEDLTSHYALFSRVDLNLVREGDLADPEALDIALAPLLPCCRRMVGQTIAREDVQRFWQMLRASIATTAADLDDVYGDARGAAAATLADALIGDREGAAELEAASPVSWLELDRFRSFVSARLDFGHVTVINGPNGSGKSSVLEALELLWSGSSQRLPSDESAAEYARHLPYKGEGVFSLDGQTSDSELHLGQPLSQPRADLARSVLSQESVATLVNAAPAQRHAALLAVTGLQVPDLQERTGVILSQEKDAANAALRAAGVAPLPRANAPGLDHLRGALHGAFSARMPGGAAVAAAAGALAAASSDAYEVRSWPEGEVAIEAVANLDATLSALRESLSPQPGLEEAFETAQQRVAAAAASRREAARGLRLLDDALASIAAPVVRSPEPAEATSPVPGSLAARWASHADSLRPAAERFREDADGVDDLEWRARLASYVEALEAAANLVPRDELLAMTRASVPAPPPAAGDAVVPEDRWLAAGFVRVPAQGAQLRPLIGELLDVLGADAAALEAITANVSAHPGRNFAVRVPATLDALCRLELANKLRRARPIMDASEELLSELLADRLAPVVRELVAAMVRFEWYFEPLRVNVAGKKVLLTGLATPRDDLDARMLLNAAERTVVGLAWFLALHLLQPPERRRVLVLDDPAGAFDAVNRAGFVSTLRSFVRLAMPEQVVVATHDEAVALLLADELAPVAGWPRDVRRVRCERDERDASVLRPERAAEHGGELSEEEQMLGLTGDTLLAASE